MNATPARLNVDLCRRQFPALEQVIDDLHPVFFDGPAGSQVPLRVIDAITTYFVTMNANHGGLFATSRASDSLLDEAHLAVADLLGVTDPGEVAFGANMTTLTLALSRAMARTWKPGDEVIVTHLDHDANVSPWVLAAQDAGAVVKRIAVKRDDCTLDLEQFKSLLSPQTKLVAIGAASNATGTINAVEEITKLAHGVGALVFVDAVHFAPHRRIDVRRWNCDFLACSAYKFFGPHVGVLWGRRALLESLPVYKLRPSPSDLPGRWMTGTQSHEGIAGVLAAVEYLAELGRQVQPEVYERRAALDAAFTAITAHEQALAAEFLTGLQSLPQIELFGIRDLARLDERVPTFAIRHKRVKPHDLAEYLDSRGVYVWNGNFYALPWTEFMGLEPDGVVRVGMLHYNTSLEVQRLLNDLGDVE